MVNHFYDEDANATRCRDPFVGDSARYVSSSDRVSCPDCLAGLTDAEREMQRWNESPNIDGLLRQRVRDALETIWDDTDEALDAEVDWMIAEARRRGAELRAGRWRKR